MGLMMFVFFEGGSFLILEVVYKYVLIYCMFVGYVIVIGWFKKMVFGFKKVFFVCDCVGKFLKCVSFEF